MIKLTNDCIVEVKQDLSNFYATLTAPYEIRYQHIIAIPLAIIRKQSVYARTALIRGGKTVNANVRIVCIVPGEDLSPKRRKPKLPPARIHFDPPNQERVFVIYWRGAKLGFFDAIVEDVDKDNCLLRRYPVRNDYVDGLLKPLPTDTPLPQ